MKQDYDNIHLNAHGGVDIDYYVAEARRLRKEAIENFFHDLGHWLKKRLTHGLSLPLHTAFDK